MVSDFLTGNILIKTSALISYMGRMMSDLKVPNGEEVPGDLESTER